MNMLPMWCWMIVTVLALVGSGLAGEAGPRNREASGERDAGAWKVFTVTPQADGRDVPVAAAFALPKGLKVVDPERLAVQMVPAEGASSVPGQVVREADKLTLWWILPTARAGKSQKWTAAFGKRSNGEPASFRLQDEKGEHLTVLFDRKPVARYMYAFDASTKERAHETYKPFTHLYDLDGKHTVTKGAGGKYTHHRGLFIGFMKLAYDDGKRNDWWHMRDGVTMVHRKFLSTAAGPVLAQVRSEVHWNDASGKPVIVEQRTQTFFRQPDPGMVLVDFASTLEAERSDVTLDGDPEHAGMQFRAHNDVAAKTGKHTKYLFPGEVTRKTVKKARDLAWAAMQMQLRDETYAVQHMNHPANPDKTRYSAYRDYGRFGAFPKAKVARGESLTLRYRLHAAEAELPDKQTLRQRYTHFARPPKTKSD